jgi:hypothetical protein
LRVDPGTAGKVLGVRTFVRREKLSEKEIKKKQDEVASLYNLQNLSWKKEKKELLETANKSEKKKIEDLYQAKEEILKQNYEKEKDRFKKATNCLYLSIK